MKFKMYIEYNGTNYAGWQKQKNAKTIQGTLIDCIQLAFKQGKSQSKFIDLQGAGRTDKGVHAIEQIAHLECETMLAPEILKMKINDILPSDINILEIEKAGNNFHARFSAVARQYLYIISKRRTAFEKRYVWWIKDKLSIEKMIDCSTLFLGKNNFSSFSDDNEDIKSKICNIELFDIFEDDMKIYFRIKADHFLWKMVRRLTGTIVEAGRDKLTENDIKAFLKSYSDIPSKFTAPPSGLFLEKIYYN